MGSLRVYLINVMALENDATRFDRLGYWMLHSVAIEGYWNYIAGVYAVKSRLSAAELRNNLIPVLSASFMISEIDVMNMDGVMPKDAWSWFYAPSSPRAQGLAALGQPAPQAQLGGLAGLGGLYKPTP